jgi:hypothetical protein
VRKRGASAGSLELDSGTTSSALGKCPQMGAVDLGTGCPRFRGSCIRLFSATRALAMPRTDWWAPYSRTLALQPASTDSARSPCDARSTVSGHGCSPPGFADSRARTSRVSAPGRAR